MNRARCANAGPRGIRSLDARRWPAVELRQTNGQTSQFLMPYPPRLRPPAAQLGQIVRPLRGVGGDRNRADVSSTSAADTDPGGDAGNRCRSVDASPWRTQHGRVDPAADGPVEQRHEPERLVIRMGITARTRCTSRVSGGRCSDRPAVGSIGLLIPPMRPLGYVLDACRRQGPNGLSEPGPGSLPAVPPRVWDGKTTKVKGE